MGMPTESDAVDVLIAEDDALVRRSLRHFLERAGYLCAEADDGVAALALARRINPRCALLDLAMPGLDGFEVARALRSDRRTKRIRIHCLTGRVDATIHSRAVEAGFDTFMTKPVDPSELLRVFEREIRTPEVRQVSGLSLVEARQLLDAWENQGCRGLETFYHEGNGFTVRGVLSPLAS